MAIYYAKILNELGQCEVGIGSNFKFYESIGMTKQDVEQSDVDNNWYLTELCPHKSKEDKEREERERLDSLTLTPADVERALYRAKGMDFTDLKDMIAQAVPTLDMKALSIEFRAKDFYRGAVAGGVRLFDTVGAILGYTSDDMDYLFQNKELPEKVEPEPEPTEKPTEEVK